MWSRDGHAQMRPLKYLCRCHPSVCRQLLIIVTRARGTPGHSETGEPDFSRPTASLVVTMETNDYKKHRGGSIKATILP